MGLSGLYPGAILTTWRFNASALPGGPELSPDGEICLYGLAISPQKTHAVAQHKDGVSPPPPCG